MWCVCASRVNALPLVHTTEVAGSTRTRSDGSTVRLYGTTEDSVQQTKVFLFYFTSTIYQRKVPWYYQN